MTSITPPRDRFQWFNTGCFVAPAFGTWGNGGQGIVNDPGINNWNSTFAKTFRIREGHSLEFRFETYNTFNHTQWLGANYTRSNANFGRITGRDRPVKSRRPCSIVFNRLQIGSDFSADSLGKWLVNLRSGVCEMNDSQPNYQASD